MMRHDVSGKKPLGRKRKKKTVDNQPAHYYKMPAGKKPGTERAKPVDKNPE
jgi:hypothetical protein